MKDKAGTESELETDRHPLSVRPQAGVLGE